MFLPMIPRLIFSLSCFYLMCPSASKPVFDPIPKHAVFPIHSSYLKGIPTYCLVSRTALPSVSFLYPLLCQPALMPPFLSLFMALAFSCSQILDWSCMRWIPQTLPPCQHSTQPVALALPWPLPTISGVHFSSLLIPQAGHCFSQRLLTA